MNHAVCADVLPIGTLPSSSLNNDDCVDNHDVNSKPTGLLIQDRADHDRNRCELSRPTDCQLHANSDNDIQVKLEPGTSTMDNKQLNRDDHVEHSDSSEKKGKTDVNDAKQNSHYYRNREKILAYAKVRYRENREKLLAYSKQYQSERKDRVKERNDEYYAKNREKLLRNRSEKITCDGCGKTITKGSLSGHLKTKYHLKRVEQNKDINENTLELSEQIANTAIETI